MIRLRNDEKGATAVEYGIMVALIAVAIIIAVSTLGGTLSGLFENVEGKIPGAPAAPAAGTGTGG
ncbi:Flp family type IVb pilin [Arthrobacter sp. V1I9]|uniref:Flp family type IVb pilin n=1 Tax=Arthrobacter sp. V1I9 TaxID=3042275 RepID=UPI0027D8A70D|nr:Flp family type IVb pilin [Arthrobacter sp. V1I9]